MTHRLLPKLVAGADDTVQVRQPSSRRSSMEPSPGDWGSFVLGVVFFYFGSVVGPCLYLDDVMLYS